MCEALLEARNKLLERLAQAQEDERRSRQGFVYARAAIIVALDQLKEGFGDPIATLEDALRETEGSP